MASTETKAERLDRELGELLQELCVVLPGAQVLSAFLFTVPFASRFTELTSGERAVFLGALICAAIASLFSSLPAPFTGSCFESTTSIPLARRTQN